MSEELKECPFCGGEIGTSNLLCGNNHNGKFWCKQQDYNTRHLPKEVEAVVEAAKDFIKVWQYFCDSKNLDGLLEDTNACYYLADALKEVK